MSEHYPFQVGSNRQRMTPNIETQATKQVVRMLILMLSLTITLMLLVEIRFAGVLHREPRHTFWRVKSEIM